MSRLRRAFQGRRALVTGHTGFKGSWLALWLTELGAEVQGYALPPERREDLFNALGLRSLVRHVEGDVRDLAPFKRAVRSFKPHFLFHLAAQPLVRASYAEPKRTFDVNVGGSVNVLEAARETPGLKAVVFVTSDKCYRNDGLARGYREEDPLGGGDPYSCSKAAAELVFSAYNDAYFRARGRPGAASARAGNVIGGGDWARDRIVPDAVRALLAGRALVLRNPEATRPWQHVLDPLHGYLTLAARLAEAPGRYSGAWNFGPADGSARSVLTLVRAVFSRWGAPEGKVAVRRASLHEARRLWLDAGKSRRRLGWRARWGFDRAVSETVRFYRGVARGAGAPALAREQLAAYAASRP